MATEKAKGLLITFEGIDFCGKTTQVLLLQEHLVAKGHEVVVVREPGGTDISEKIRHILLDKRNVQMKAITEMLLYQASRAQVTGEVILPALEEGKTVICDRYFDSSTAYQGYGRGLDLQLVQTLNQVTSLSLRPDLTFVLDMPPEDSFDRVGNLDLFVDWKVIRVDRMEVPRTTFHEKVREGYLQIAKSEPERFRVIPATKTVEEIAALVAMEVDKLLEKTANSKQ